MLDKHTVIINRWKDNTEKVNFLVARGFVFLRNSPDQVNMLEV